MSSPSPNASTPQHSDNMVYLMHVAIGYVVLLCAVLLLFRLLDRHRNRNGYTQAIQDDHQGNNLAQLNNITQTFELFTNRLNQLETLVEKMICEEEEETDCSSETPSESSSCEIDHYDCDSDKQGDYEDEASSCGSEKDNNSGFHVGNESFDLIGSSTSLSSHIASESSQSALLSASSDVRGSYIDSLFTIRGTTPAAPCELVDASVLLTNPELSLEAFNCQKRSLHVVVEQGAKLNPTLVQSGQEESHNEMMTDHVTEVSRQKRASGLWRHAILVVRIVRCFLQNRVKQEERSVPVQTKTCDEKMTGHVAERDEQKDTLTSFQINRSMFECLSQPTTGGKGPVITPMKINLSQLINQPHKLQLNNASPSPKASQFIADHQPTNQSDTSPSPKASELIAKLHLANQSDASPSPKASELIAKLQLDNQSNASPSPKDSQSIANQPDKLQLNNTSPSHLIFSLPNKVQLNNASPSQLLFNQPDKVQLNNQYNASPFPKYSMAAWLNNSDENRKQWTVPEISVAFTSTAELKKTMIKSGVCIPLPRVKEILFMEGEVLRGLEMNLKQKHLQHLLGVSTLLNKSRELVRSKATPQQGIATSPPNVELYWNSSCDTPFISREIRDKLEFHIQRRKLQGHWSVSEVLPVSEDAPTAPPPNANPSKVLPKPQYDIQVMTSGLPFISRSLKEELEATVAKRKALKMWDQQRELELPPDVARDVQKGRCVAKVQLPKNPQTPTKQSRLREEAQSKQNNSSSDSNLYPTTTSDV